MNWLLRFIDRIQLRLIQGSSFVNVLVFACLCLFGLALQSFASFQAAEWKLYDRGVGLIRTFAPSTVANDVIVVGIDEESFRQFSEPFALWHPHFADLLQAFVLAKPSVVGMDIVLPDRSYEAVVPGIDRELMRGLLQVRSEVPVFFAQTLDDTNRPRPIFAGFRALIGEDRFASAVLCLDEDSVLRRHMADGCADSGSSSALASKMAQALGVSDRGLGLIDFRAGGMIEPIPMHRIIDLYKQGEHGKLRELLGGKPVLVGLVLPLEDRLRVPVALQALEPDNRRVPGVMAHAQLLRTLINHGPIQQVPFWIEGALIALACLWWFAPHGFQKSLIYWSLFVLLPLFSLYLLWLGILLMPAGILLVAKTAYVTRQGVDWLRIEHHRKQLMEAFTGHLSKAALQRLVHEQPADTDVGLKTEQVHAVVLACRLHAPGLLASTPSVKLSGFSEYYQAIKVAVNKSGGMVDRLQDDEVLAWFGTPVKLDDPERAALEAALFIRRESHTWLQLLQRDGLADCLQIGIASGELVAGRAALRDANPFVVIGPAIEQARMLARDSTALSEGTSIRVCPQTAVALKGHGMVLETGSKSYQLILN